MKKGKIIISVFAIVFAIGLFLFHMYINSSIIFPNHSKVWSKSILVEKNDINQTPALLNMNTNAVIAYQSNDELKIKIIDNSGNILKEEKIETDNKIPTKMKLYSDDKDNIYLQYILFQDTDKFVREIKMDKELNIIKDEFKENIKELVYLSDGSYAIFYDEYIEFTNLISNKTIKIKTDKNVKAIAGNSFNGKHIIGYLEDGLNYKYVVIDKDKIVKEGVGLKISETTKVKISNSFIVVDNDMAFVIIEYRQRQSIDYGIRGFYIDGNNEDESIMSGFEIGVPPKTGLLNNKHWLSFFDVYDIEINPQKGNRLIASTDISALKDKSIRQITEFEICYDKELKKLNCNLIDINTNTAKDSIKPIINGEYIVYIDCIKQGSSRLELISTYEEFKNATNGLRDGDLRRCIELTLQKVITGSFYVIVLGSMWILITIAIVSLISAIEFKFSDKVRKILFVLCYIFMMIIKTFVMCIVYYYKYKYAMPDWFTCIDGIIICTIMSIPFMIYGYKKYADDLDYNVLAIVITPIMIVDSMLTLMLYVPMTI